MTGGVDQYRCPAPMKARRKRRTFTQYAVLTSSQRQHHCELEAANGRVIGRASATREGLTSARQEILWV